MPGGAGHDFINDDMPAAVAILLVEVPAFDARP
jgi:hypothetical protein